MRPVTVEQLKSAIVNFRFSGALTFCEPYGSGHINDTYLLKFDTEYGVKKVILQRINTDIFTNPKIIS